MANPITWRNVNAPSNHVAVRLLEGAQGSFNNAFKSLGDAIGNVQDNRQAEWDSRVQDNTQRFMDELSKYRSPEELQAAQQSGVFDGLRSQFGDALDQERVRNAVPEFMTTLRNRANAANEYADGQRERTEAPLIDQAKEHWLSGNMEAGNKILEGTDFQNDAELLAFRNDLLSQQTKEQRATENYNREKTRFGWDVQEHTENQAQKEQQKRVNSLLNSTIQERNTRASGYLDTVRSAAEKLNLPRDPKTGLPQTSKLSDAQQIALAEMTSDSNLRSDTQLINDTVVKLRKEVPDISEDLVGNFRTTLENSLLGQSSIASTDENRLANEKQIVDSQYLKNNPFAHSGDYDPYTEAGNIINENKEILGKEINGENAQSKIAEVLSKGYIVGENNEKIRVTPAVVRVAVQSMNDELFTGFDRSFEEGLTELIKNSDLGLQWENYQNATKAKKALESGFMAKNGTEVNQARNLEHLLRKLNQ